MFSQLHLNYQMYNNPQEDQLAHAFLGKCLTNSSSFSHHLCEWVGYHSQSPYVEKQWHYGDECQRLGLHLKPSDLFCLCFITNREGRRRGIKLGDWKYQRIPLLKLQVSMELQWVDI